DLKRLAGIAEDAKGTDVNVSFAIDGSPVGNDPKRFGEWVHRLFSKAKDRIQRVEIINEANGRMQPKEYVDTFLRPAYENIRKASPNTKVLSPVMCGIGADQARYLEELYKLGLKDLCDELTFHPYAGNFDDGAAVENMQRLQEIIAANGDSKKPVHFTEAGYFHGGWSDLGALREIIKLAVAQYAWQNAVMGIDHRHNFYYFTDIMGYYDMWLRATQLTPAAVALRTYTSFVKGRQRARRLDLGSLEVVRAFRYGGPDRQVVVMWTSNNWAPSEQPDVTTEVTFETDARAVEWFDCFGNPLPARVRGGRLALAVGSFPSYLVAPAKARLAPVPQRWGTNLALASLGATAESSAELGTSPAVSAIDGGTASDPRWRSLTPNELPQSLTVTLAGPAPIDRVGLWSYSARGYDLSAMGADGRWVKLASRRDRPRQRFRMETFRVIVTDQVRLTIVDSYTDHAEVAELQVFSPTAAPAEAVELVNWALNSKGATARASSEMMKEVTVAEQDWGAKKPRIVKMKLEGKAANATDGKRLVSNWREFFPTTWMAAPGAAVPQWLEVTFAGPKRITYVTVYTIAFATWTPATSGVRDWDVQVWSGGKWKTVDSVTGNTRVSKTTRFKSPVTTEKIRILVKATNDPEGTVGLMEVQAFGPAK
ncbi:MAG: discoidin domain-containing protein, partial [Phycisphaerae bacterium]